MWPGCGDGIFSALVHILLITSMHTSGVIYSKGSIWLLNLSSLDGLPLVNCVIYFDHNPKESPSESEFTSVRTQTAVQYLQDADIDELNLATILQVHVCMVSRKSYSGRNLFPYLTCPTIYDCYVVICHMHMTASLRIFCVVLWSAAMLTKSPQVPLKGHKNGCIGRFFAGETMGLWESESSKSWAFCDHIHGGCKLMEKLHVYNLRALNNKYIYIYVYIYICICVYIVV